MIGLVPEGAPVAVVAPASDYDEDRFQAGLAAARMAGLQLDVLPGLHAPHRTFAANDDTRLAHLTEALTSERYGAVWAVRGGYGVTRLLDRLPWDRVVPRPVIGFSDLTPLLEAMFVTTGAVQVHGPVLHSLADATPEAQAHLFALLDGRPTEPLQGETWVDGSAEGRLVGGNLALLAATAGTPWAVRAAGGILVLEDVGEPAYRIDRMLQQLVSAGAFDGVAGIALGGFTDCRVPEDADWTLRDVLIDHLGPLRVPVIADLPFGHHADNHALPIGARARLGRGMLSWS